MLIGMLTLYCLLKETASRQKFNYCSLLFFPHLPCPYMKTKNHFPHTNKYLTHDNLHLLACFVFVLYAGNDFFPHIWAWQNAE